MNSYIERTFKLMCLGRTLTGQSVLDEPVEVEVRIYRSPNSKECCCNVECPYNTGGHGQRCKASHPWTGKVGEGVLCPFVFDYPYALKDAKWEMPVELRETVDAIMLEKE